jgi:hypothetical protein
VQEEVAQVQVLVAELRLAQVVHDLSHLRREPGPVAHGVAAQLVVVEVLVELHRRLQRFEDHRVAQSLVDPEPRQVRHRPRGGNSSPLKALEPLELEEGGAAAEQPPPGVAVAMPGVELEVVGAAAHLEPPDLPVPPVLDQPPVLREVAEGRFELRRGHRRRVSRMRRIFPPC